MIGKFRSQTSTTPPRFLKLDAGILLCPIVRVKVLRTYVQLPNAIRRGRLSKFDTIGRKQFLGRVREGDSRRERRPRAMMKIRLLSGSSRLSPKVKLFNMY